MPDPSDAVTAMGLQTSPDHPLRMASAGQEPNQPVGKSGLRAMPALTRPGRHHSFILGRSDARTRPLLNQEERDRLHCWSMIVALASSAAGTTLLLTAVLR